MVLPLAGKCLVIEPPDQAKALGPRYRDDVLPLLVPLEDFEWESLKLPPNAPVLKDFPHTEISIYTEVGMSTDLSMLSTVQFRGRV